MTPTEPCENCGHPSVAWTDFWDDGRVLCEFIQLEHAQIFTPHTPENCRLRRVRGTEWTISPARLTIPEELPLPRE
jgi:hypothetical protein